MATYYSVHYGVTISVQMLEFPGCCGAHTLAGFRVEGTREAKETLTEEQKHKMYDELMIELVDKCPAVMVAADAVINTDEWGDDVELERGGGTLTSSWMEGSYVSGDVSLEDFCKYHTFEESSLGKNRNSGNLIGVFTKATRFPSKEDFYDDAEYLFIERPSFDDEVIPEKEKPADVEKVIAALRRAIESREGM